MRVLCSLIGTETLDFINALIVGLHSLLLYNLILNVIVLPL